MISTGMCINYLECGSERVPCNKGEPRAAKRWRQEQMDAECQRDRRNAGWILRPSPSLNFKLCARTKKIASLIAFDLWLARDGGGL